MAVLKYKDKNGEWQKVTSKGGGGAEVEVHIGSDEPIDDGAKLWINPAEEGGGGGGAAVEVVDNLESESTTAALSANQGRVLKEYVDNTILQAITITLNTEV